MLSTKLFSKVTIYMREFSLQTEFGGLSQKWEHFKVSLLQMVLQTELGVVTKLGALQDFATTR